MAYELGWIPQNDVAARRSGKALRRAILLRSPRRLMLLASCREDMQNQPKFIPLRENPFYPDRPFGAADC